MAKNIVICCDGTGNEYGDANTNVVKLYGMLVRDHDRQIAYYDPGVGTLSAMGAITKPVKVTTEVVGLVFAYGLTRNIEDAYLYLMDHYEDGDAIYLFGFSRGAYTVRALAALLHCCGLLEKGSHNMVPYASKMFKRPIDPALRAGFKQTYARECKPHFIGIWDTVSSVGWIYDQVSLPYTTNNPDVRIGRHAISIDERRCYYRQNLWGPAGPGQDLMQVWFAGVHCDVGGGYPEAESGLSKITLAWMTDEAVAHGLLIEPRARDMIIPDRDTASHSAPDPTASIHRGLQGPWWALEYWPKRYVSMRSSEPKTRWKLPRGQRRFIRDGSLIHRSVIERRDSGIGYDPSNLPREHEVV